MLAAFGSLFVGSNLIISVHADMCRLHGVQECRLDIQVSFLNRAIHDCVCGDDSIHEWCVHINMHSRHRPYQCMGHHLRKNTIDRRYANDPTSKGHEAHKQQIPVVGRWLAQVEVCSLCQLRGDAVVKVEKDGDDQGWHKSPSNIHTWHLPHILFEQIAMMALASNDGLSRPVMIAVRASCCCFWMCKAHMVIMTYVLHGEDV